MKTVADFKRMMVPGSQWEFTSDWCPEPVIRECKISQSNSFALTHPTRSTLSWGNWPKKNEATIDGHTVRIIHTHGWLQYIYQGKPDAGRGE